jgi:GPH family glycoside/pentoside/hexuronide:cation symporter
VQFYTLRLVDNLGHGDRALGFQLTMAVFAAIAVVMFLFCFGLTKERVQPVRDQKTSTGRDLLDLVTNVPWLVLCLIGILQVCFVAIRGGAILFYFKYYVGDMGAAAMFMVIGSVMSLVGTFLIQYVTRYTGRKNAFIGCMLLATAALAASYWVRPDQLVLLYVYNMTYCVLTGPTSALLWAMFADTADYSEWKTGRRATGLVFSASGMSNKFGWVIGGALAAALLAIYGFQANVVQTTHAQEGIRILMAIAPAVGTLVCGLGMLFYRLESKIPKIQSELAVNRAKKLVGA